MNAAMQLKHMSSPMAWLVIVGAVCVGAAAPPPANAQMAATARLDATDTLSGSGGETALFLDGRAPVILGQAGQRRFRYSFSAASGYDSAVDDVAHLAGSFTQGEGYGGILLHSRRFNLLLQHDAQFTRSFETGIGLEQYQRTTGTFAGRTSRRVNWTFLLENGYGADSARAVGNLGTSVSNAVVVPDQNAVAFGLTSGSILTDHAQFGMERRLSAARIFHLDAGAYYHHFFNTGASNEQYSAVAGFRQQWSARQVVGVQGEAVLENYTGLQCTTGSVAFYSYTRLSRVFRLEGNVGPVFGSANCSGTYEYNASLAAGVGRNGQLYIAAARQRNNGLVQQATWENTTYAGFAFGQPRRLMVRADAGYANYVLANPTPANPDLRGYFAAIEMHHQISATTDLAFKTRYFYRGPGGLDNGAATGGADTAQRLNRFICMVAYTWSPRERPARLEQQRVRSHEMSGEMSSGMSSAGNGGQGGDRNGR